jgi:hypothetical protein
MLFWSVTFVATVNSASLALLVASWQPIGVFRLSCFFRASRRASCDSIIAAYANTTVHLSLYVLHVTIYVLPAAVRGVRLSYACSDWRQDLHHVPCMRHSIDVLSIHYDNHASDVT